MYKFNMKIIAIIIFSLFKIELVGNIALANQSDTTLLVGPGVEKTNPEFPIGVPTGQLGPLSIDAVSVFDFGKIKIGEPGMAMIPEGELLGIQVTDSRGEGTGWSVTAKISEFENSEKTKNIKATVSIPTGKVVTKTANLNNAPISVSADLNNDSMIIFSASKGKGMGSFTNLFEGNDTKIKVPGGVLVDSYSATITWTLQDTPL